MKKIYILSFVIFIITSASFVVQASGFVQMGPFMLPQKQQVFRVTDGTKVKAFTMTYQTSIRSVYDALVSQFPDRQTYAFALGGWAPVVPGQNNFINLSEAVNKPGYASTSFLFVLTGFYGLQIRNNELFTLVVNFPLQESADKDAEEIKSLCSRYPEQMHLQIAGGANFAKKIAVTPTTTIKEMQSILAQSFPNRDIALALPGWFGAKKDKNGNFINLSKKIESNEGDQSFLCALTEIYGTMIKADEFLVVMDNIPSHAHR